jgi:broad specificity phosphatase PhoE
MKYNLFFETHSTSLDNEKSIASGQLDPPLSKKGIQQAQELGKRYQNIDISTIYCSDLQRSFTTAEIAFKSRNIPIVRDSRLREWNYGKFNGHPILEIEKLKLLYIHKSFPEGESFLNAYKRIKSFIQVLPNEPILIIGHRAVYYTLELLSSSISIEELLSKPWNWQPGWKYQNLFF